MLSCVYLFRWLNDMGVELETIKPGDGMISFLLSLEYFRISILYWVLAKLSEVFKNCSSFAL